jgi:glutathione S-transferase
MILIGQYDSPFVRRVAIAMRLYGIAFEHRPWSTFGDAEKIAAYNPLRRVPTLVLDDGEVLVDSVTILDHLDQLAGPLNAMVPNGGPARRQVLRVCALGTGLADKAVSLVYERVLHQPVSQRWVDRCVEQITAVLDALEADRAARTTPFWFGDTISHADIAVACALRFTAEAHSELFALSKWPALARHAARCEALEPFQTIVQPFLPP